MSSDPGELETRAIELITLLDNLRDGSGPKAFAMYQRALSAQVRPVLVKQRAILSPYAAKLDALLQSGCTLGEAASKLRAAGEAADPAVLMLEAQLILALRNLVVDLEALADQRIPRAEVAR